MRHKLLTAFAAVFGVAAPMMGGAVPAVAATNTAQIADAVMRGGVVVYKYDGESRKSVAQGGATLAGGEFTITNTSENPIIYIDEFGHKDTKAPGESWVIKTVWDEERDAFVAKTPQDGLPYGSYHIQETKASSGYGLPDDGNCLAHGCIPGYLSEADRKWVTTGYDFEITEDGDLVEFKGETGESDTPGCYNPPVRGGIEVVKRDHDWLRPSAQGNASLEGGVWEIYNASCHPIQLWDHFDKETGHGVLAKPGIDNNKDGVSDSDVDEDGWVRPGGKVATIVSGTDGRAQTFMDALPVGWYKVVEVKAPKGYALEDGWFANVEVTEDDWDALVVTDCDDPVLRGGVHFRKYDADLGFESHDPQGDAHLGKKLEPEHSRESDTDGDGLIDYEYVEEGSTCVDGAVITIYNESTRPVYMNPKLAERYEKASGDFISYADGEVAPGEVIATVITNKTGDAYVYGLPYGHYRAVETTASEGYLVNEAWNIEFDITDGEGADGELTADGENIVCDLDTEEAALAETVIRGNISLTKRDWETGGDTPLGGATLAGAEFSVTNSSNHSVFFNDKLYEVGFEVTKLVTDENGHAQVDGLPYGTYTIRETKAPEGYVVNNAWMAIVTIRENGVTVSGDTACEDGILTNDMYHGADGKFFFPSFDFSGNWSNTTITIDGKPVTLEQLMQMIQDGRFPCEGSSCTGLPSMNAIISWVNWLMSGSVDHNDPNNIQVTKPEDGMFCAPFDRVSRNDIRFDKKDGDGHTQLSGIPFVLRSKTTGEWHVLVTDENGIVDTTAWMPDGDNLPSQGDYTWNLHSKDTNASDAAVTESDGAFEVTDESELNAKAGVFFFGATDAGDRGALDYVSAMPYDEYELIELRVEANKGRELVHRDITLKYANNDVVDLGTITNDSDMPEVTDPVVGTTIEAHKSVDAGDNAEVKGGQDLTYTINLKNTGADAAEHVRVRDYIPAGTSYVSAANDGVFVSAEDSADGRAYVEWVTGKVASGAETSVSMTVKVDKQAKKSILANQAKFDAVSGDVVAGNPENGSLTGRSNVVYNTTDGSTTPTSLDATKWVEGADENGTATIGSELTYHVRVTNNGNTTVPAAGVFDVIPTGTELVRRNGASGYEEPDASDGVKLIGNYAVSWNLGEMKPGASAEVWFKVRVIGSAYSVVANSATYGAHVGTDVTGGLANTTNTVETKLVKHPELAVEKSVDDKDGKVSAGQIVTYTIKVTNNGHGNATDVDVTDMLPAGLQLVDGSVSDEFAGHGEQTDDGYAVKWLVPTIAHDGGSASMSFKARVAESNKIGASIDNAAVATADGEDGVASNKVTITVADAINGLEIEKSSTVEDGARVNPGDEIHYVIDWTNNGNLPIFNLGIRDVIPEHTTYIPGSIIVTGADGTPSTDIDQDNNQDGDEGEDGTEDGSNGTSDSPVWGGEEGVGDKTDFAAIKDIAMDGDSKATVEGDGITDWDGLFSAIAKLKANESIKFIVRHETGYDKQWKLTVDADGSARLVFAFLTPSIDDGPEAEHGNGIGGNYDKLTNAVWAIQNELKPGETGRLEFTVKVDEDVPDNTTISNYATYNNGVTGMPVSDMPHKTNTVDVLVGAPHLTATKSVDKTVVAVGSEITYTVEVTNDGTGIAEGVVISDTFRDQDLKGCSLIPDSVKVEGGTSAEDSAELIRALDASSTTVKVRAHKLLAGETMKLTFSVRVVDADAGDVFKNKAQFGDNGELDGETNEVETTVAKADLHISAMSDPESGSTVERGDTITYTWVVSNDADVRADGIAVNAQIPENATYVEDSATGGLEMVADSTLGSTGISLGAHESKTFTAQVRVNDVQGDAVVRFRATCGFDTHADKPLAIDSNEIEHMVAAIETNLKITSEATPANGEKVAAGDTIHYTIRVTNDTRIAADGVAVRAEVPGHTMLVAGSAAGLKQMATTSDGRAVLGAVDQSFEAFETKTYTFDVTVMDDAADDEQIVMRATCGLDSDVSVDLPVAAGEIIHTVNEEIPHLTITEKADPKAGLAVKRGDTITYTVTIANDGKADAAGVAVHTTIDPKTTFIEGSASGLNKIGYDADKQEILGATDITIPVGASREFTYSVRVNGDAAKGEMIANRASCGFSDSAWSPLEIDAQEVTHGVEVKQATLSIKAFADPKAESIIKPGQTINYTVEVYNTSDVDATGVAVNTEIPAYTQLVDDSMTHFEDLGDGVLGATGLNIKAGRKVALTFAVRVNDEIPPAYTIKMRATTGYSDDASKPLAIDSNEVEHNMAAVPPELDIVLEQDPASGTAVAPGDTITYTVTVTNNGTSRAKKVGIYDIAPFGTTLVEGSLKAASEDDTTHIIGDATFTQGILCVMAGDLEPGETATMTYQVTVNLDCTGVIRNRALWVSPAADPDAEAGDDGMTDFPFDFGQDMSGQQKVSEKKSANLFGFLGIVIPDGSNTGSTGSDSNHGTDSGSDTDTDGEDTGNGSGGSNDTESPVKPGHGSDGTDPSGDGSSTNTDGSGESNETESPTNKPQVELRKRSSVADGAFVRTGDVITYTLTATNKGETRANNLVIDDKLPDGLRFVKNSAKVSNDAFTVKYTKGVVRTTGTLEAGESVKITFRAKVTATEDGVIANTGTWYQKSGDVKVDGGKSNTNEIQVTHAALEFVKTADVADGSVVEDGQTITYTLRIRNTGAVTATPVVTDTLPEGFTLDEATLPESAQYNAETRTITFAVTELHPGEAAEFTFAGTVSGEPNTEIVNRASWSDKTTGDTGESNDHEVTIAGDVIVNMTKTADVADGGYVRAGQIITYTLTLTNDGEVAIKPIFTDQLPAGMEFVADGAPDGMTVDVNGLVTFAAPDTLEPGDTASVQIRARVSADAQRGDVFANKGVWKNADGDETGESNTHEVTCGIASASILKSTDVEEGSVVAAGDTITYTLKVTNDGDFAFAPVVTDKLPAHVVLDETTLPDGAEVVDGVITFPATELESGQSVEFTFAVKVADDIAPTTEIANTAHWAEDGTENGGDSNTSTVKTGEPVFDVAKSADVDKAEIGDVVTWTVTIRDIGTASGDAEIADELPEGLVLDTESITAQILPAEEGSDPIDIDPSNFETDGNAIHGRVRVDEGCALVLTYKTTVTGVVSSPDGATLKNEVKVKSPETDGDDTSASDTVDVLPVPEPEGNLTVTKDGLSDAGKITEFYTPGEDQQYRITVENGTDDDMSNAIVEDAAGAGLSIVKVTDEQGNPVSVETTTEIKPEGEKPAANITLDEVKKLYNEFINADGDEAGRAAFDALAAYLKTANDTARTLELDGKTAGEFIDQLAASDDETIASYLVTRKIGDVESVLKVLEAHSGDTAATEQVEKPELSAGSVRWTTGELKSGEKRSYIVTVKVSANATETIRNVANVYGADLKTPLATATCDLRETASVIEDIKKGGQDMPTTGIALGALALIGSGAAVTALGVKNARRAQRED